MTFKDICDTVDSHLEEAMCIYTIFCLLGLSYAILFAINPGNKIKS